MFVPLSPPEPVHTPLRGAALDPDMQRLLPGLTLAELGKLAVLRPGIKASGRQVVVNGAGQSAARVRGERLDLAVAPADAGFARWLVAGFARPGQPAAAAPASRDLLARASRVARGDASVLIEGATGTGKEGLARLVHDESPRRDGPLVAVNCAALAESMLEAVLFGHERGAFTGAQGAQPGLIRAAHGGTLFLDEVAELPLPLQAKLLRVLQEREVLPLGATRPVPVDFRLVAAGNRDLAAEVAAGRFRADLYYRLAVLPLATLPLAARPDDIPAITAALLLARPGVDGLIGWPTPDALDALMAHDWPGNVRELANVLDRALVLGDGARITRHDLLFDPPARAAPLPHPPATAPVPPAAPMAGLPPLPPSAPTDRVPVPPVRLPALVKAQELAAIRQVLAKCASRRDAARQLGISERTLRYKLAASAGADAQGAR